MDLGTVIIIVICVGVTAFLFFARQKRLEDKNLDLLKEQTRAKIEQEEERLKAKGVVNKM